MPRAKVRADKRQRVVQACRQCKVSKRKCNSPLPCSHCIKRGISDECEVTKDPTNTRRAVSRQNVCEDPQPDSTTDGSTTCFVEDVTTDSAPVTSFHLAESTDLLENDNVQGHGHAEIASPGDTRARMLSNNEGELVFIGRSASISFLQLVQETVARCIGPCDFSGHISGNEMLEVDLNLYDSNDRGPPLTVLQQQQCMENYFVATKGLIDILSKEESESLLYVRPEADSYFAALRLAALAIGMQTGPVEIIQSDGREKTAFLQAQTIVFRNMLDNPNLDMIRALVLLSFYMLGACRRNAAFLYLGIAARAAHTLGLHTVESYQVIDEVKRSVCLKCWKSLVSLDLMVCSILGRTTAILAQRNRADSVLANTDSCAHQSGMELEAAYRLALIVNAISVRYNEQEVVTAEVAHGYLQSLNNWSTILPAKLRPGTIPDDDTSQSRQSLIGCVHISCFYYFAVMLVTRPFLIMHVGRKLSQGSEESGSASGDEHDISKELASACIDAAIYMAQTCSDCLDLDILAENMCLMKAWIFAAGLVLGFGIFASSETDRTNEYAFTSCRQVLRKLAIRSPQASQYHEILTLLSSAVEKHRQLYHSRRTSKEGGLVNRIMTISSLGHTSLSAQGLSGRSLPRNSLNDEVQASAFGQTFSNAPNGICDSAGDYARDWDDIRVPSIENFVFDDQNFGMMPWEVL